MTTRTDSEYILSQDGRFIGRWDDVLEEWVWFPINSQRGREVLEEMEREEA